MNRFKVKNEFGLTGENLEYYEDIEYLKELTRQATALMSRSNAVYNNILNDFDVGHVIGGHSITAIHRTKSLDTARCDNCGLSHAVNYCILKEIMSEDLQAKDDKVESGQKRSLSRSTFQPSTWHFNQERVEESVTHEGYVKPVETPKPTNLPIFDKLSPKELLDSYEMVCARYGRNNGRRFLIAHTMANVADVKIEPWTVPCDARPEKVVDSEVPPKITYDNIERECLPPELYNEQAQTTHLCTDYGDEVRKKLEQLVELSPTCEATSFETTKNWKGIFKKQRRGCKKEKPIAPERPPSTFSVSSKSHNECPNCLCRIEDCNCDSPCMQSPKFQCEKMDKMENNYLITMRQRLERRRYRKGHRSTAAASRDSQPVEKKSTNFHHKTFLNQESHLLDCLIDAIDDTAIGGDDEFRRKVGDIADLTTPDKMMEESTWQNWIHAHNRKEALSNTDEDIDSADTDIFSDVSALSNHSAESDLDYKINEKLPHTHIPFAQEAYRLTDILFDKISLKLEKSVFKNTFKVDRLFYRPTFANLLWKIKMFENVSDVYYGIGQRLQFFSQYSKRLKPLYIRKQSKLERLEALARKALKVDQSRERNEGIQLRKPFGQYDKELKYSRKGYLSGFSKKRRNYLEKPESHRIKSYNLVGDDQGRKISKKTIHKDFRLIRNLFSDESEYGRDSLMDEGMKRRLEKFKEISSNIYKESLPSPPEPDSIDDGNSDEPAPLDSATSEYTRVIRAKKEELEMTQSSPSKWQCGRIKSNLIKCKPSVDDEPTNQQGVINFINQEYPNSIESESEPVVKRRSCSTKCRNQIMSSEGKPSSCSTVVSPFPNKLERNISETDTDRMKSQQQTRASSNKSKQGLPSKVSKNLNKVLLEGPQKMVPTKTLVNARVRSKQSKTISSSGTFDSKVGKSSVMS